MKKEALFDKLRSHTIGNYPMPPMDDINGIHYDDTVGQFVKSSEHVGSIIVHASPEDDLNDIIRKCYPEAKVFSSNLPEINIAQRDPNTVAEATNLDGTDVGIVEGKVGVAENGCVWIPQTMKERAVCFICEYLVIVLEKKNIVDNMHEAYDRIEMTDYGFGTFISGPSKTADIEQALVMGAQAARGVTVILLD